jgi:transcriptional regulator with XRE-family HTH domain
MPTRFGETLKQLREKRGATQQDLAKQSGLTQGFIARLETAIKRPRLATILIISSILGLNQEEIRSLCYAADHKVPFDTQSVLSLFNRTGYCSPVLPKIPEKKEKILVDLARVLEDHAISDNVKNSIRQTIKSLLKVVSQSRVK